MHFSPKGHTLIEIMVVVAIMVILSYIGFSVTVGVFDSNKLKRAEADLVIIQTALEEYKMRFGDYPQEQATYSGVLNIQEFLFNALNGKFMPDGTSVADKPFLNNIALELKSNGLLPNPASATAVSNYIIDPWGAAYVYRYDPKNAANSGPWKNFGYVLYSMGPDGLDAGLTSDGHKDLVSPQNLDNVFAF
ncbi:prepilin-type N-terminal cleavage/methylation domain-containing protein [Puniceicoccaceae bacterium K14]|nr:prepilin-type N-terminal cleavage/methylation domain-containing protein [Puniceicoccaceae bacterium K14]